MLNELRSFAKLINMDGAARSFEKELRELPEQMEGMRADVAVLRKLLDAEQAQLDEAKALRDQRSLDLKLKIEALQKAKVKGSKASSLREVDAAEREVEANRRIIKQREEQILEVEEVLESKAAVLEERKSQFDEANGILQQEEEAANARLEELRGKRDEVLAGRDAIVLELPKAMVKRYERLKTRPKYNAASFVGLDGICQSCRMELPAQMTIEVQRADAFHQCPVCNAFLISRQVGIDAGVLEPEVEADEETE